MFMNNKFCRIVITGLFTMILVVVTACASSADTKAEMDGVMKQMEEQQEIMDRAHDIAEHARFFGESEDSEIIVDAKSYWHEANNQYNTLYTTYTELKTKYNNELKAEDEERKKQEASKGRYVGKFKITAYTPHPSENGGYNVTATGKPLTGNEWKICAIDPAYWSYGTKFYIDEVGYVTAEDCGGAIKSMTRMDLLVPYGQANSWGIQYRNVYVVE